MCPPGTDQTTRIPQKWSVMVPALQEQYNVDTMRFGERSHRFDPSVFFRSTENHITFDAFARLAKHEPLHRTTTQPGAPMQLSAPRSGKGSAIEDLPAELLGMLFASAALSTRDIVVLGLASQTLWEHLLAHLARVNSKASWANTPLLCTGTYLTSVPQAIHELHPGMADEERTFFGPVTGGRNRMFPSHGRCPARRWNWGARATFTDRSETSFAEQVTQDVKEVTEKANICAADIKTIEASLSNTFSPVATTNHESKWVLRNLTTQEYVALKHRKINHSEANYFHVKGLPNLSLDKLIIMRAGWTDVPSTADSILTSFANGMWAGHSFDVVHSMQVESGSYWKDVTTDIHKQAKLWSGSEVLDFD